ncbi:hypothetical protein [Endozoicomonas sp. GU-1]|uniref:hypothetical protein n=1 Tax=Endozoicomonas sp. GU-1 TaxID=3009078 RepID=UPI0022B53898|nr:hypothetical protein [Endozoicomonas sp. GU-1]WBA86504.1 hypothetical protein O3276_00135 [Endozoicomonas sp. GU-1]
MTKFMDRPADSKIHPVTFNRDKIRAQIDESVSDQLREEYDEDLFESHLDEITNQVIAKLEGNFVFISQNDFDWQVQHYGEGEYFNDAKPGDLLWFDGELYCDHITVNGYWEEACQKDDRTLEEVGDSVLYFMCWAMLPNPDVKKAEGENQA